jgi:hypothetical protein
MGGSVVCLRPRRRHVTEGAYVYPWCIAVHRGRPGDPARAKAAVSTLLQRFVVG